VALCYFFLAGHPAIADHAPIRGERQLRYSQNIGDAVVIAWISSSVFLVETQGLSGREICPVSNSHRPGRRRSTDSDRFGTGSYYAYRFGSAGNSLLVQFRVTLIPASTAFIPRCADTGSVADGVLLDIKQLISVAWIAGQPSLKVIPARRKR
jgi:hypothetical protein